MNITDGQLELRALEPTDLDVLYQWENDVELWQYGSSITPFSRKQLWDYIETYDGDIYRSRQLRLMVVECSSRQPIGTIDLFDYDPIHGRAQVGVLIDKTHRGKGYGARTVALLGNYCSRYVFMNQLVAIVANDNEDSLNMFYQVGFIKTGELKWWLKRGDRYVDAALLQKKL